MDPCDGDFRAVRSPKSPALPSWAIPLARANQQGGYPVERVFKRKRGPTTSSALVLVRIIYGLGGSAPLLYFLQETEEYMRIAQVAPLYESVPPHLYGGTERIVSYLTEELVRRGNDVTLFASGASVTAAKLYSGYR